MARIGLIIVKAILLLLLATGAAFATERGPSGCPPGVSPDEFVCFTIAEESARQRKEAKLEKDLSVRPKRRLFTPWASAGAEYLPNSTEWKPYAIGGVRVGRVSMWGGFFGETPAAGVGWNW